MKLMTHERQWRGGATAVAFGMFDGVHEGHAELMRTANEVAAQEGLSMLAIDELGLDAVDRRMLETMIVKFEGRPVGLDTIAAATGEDATTIEDVYEPYLLQLGFIARTPRGRIVMPAGYRHMNYVPRQEQTKLEV